MNKHKAAKIRMMAAEGKSVKQISAATDVSDEEVEKYLLSEGIRPTYTVKQSAQEKREAKKHKYIPRVLDKPIK